MWLICDIACYRRGVCSTFRELDIMDFNSFFKLLVFEFAYGCGWEQLLLQLLLVYVVTFRLLRLGSAPEMLFRIG